MNVETSTSFESLIPGLLQRDSDAEEAFYRLAHSRLMAWARANFGIPHDEREDFAIEVIEKVLLRLHSFQAHRGKFTTWMFAVARNHRLDQIRRRNSGRDPLHQAIGDDILEWLESPAKNDSEERIESDTGTKRHAPFREKLARLTPEDLEFLQLVCCGTFTSDEIADQLGMSAANVRKKKERLLRRCHSES